MKKKQYRIYLDQWLNLKPYRKHNPCDTYYLKLCNRVQEVIKDFIILRMYLTEEETGDLSCFLTAYFEDQISQTGLWQTFVRLHRELYGKWLPFYDTGSDYYEDEINGQDLCFLCWYYLNSRETERMISPYNDFLSELSQQVLEVFEEAWEVAPENELLREAYQLPENCDYYQARMLMDKILFQSYLFFPDSGLRFQDDAANLLQEDRRNPNMPAFISELRDSLVHGTHTKLLSLTGKKWAAELLGREHPRYADLLELSPRVQGYFLYKSQNQTHILLEHIASAKPFELLKETFDHASSLHTPGQILFISMLRWQQEWWFSGLHMVKDHDAALIDEQKHSPEARQSVAFLDQQESKILELLQEQYQNFLKFNGGSPIAFMAAGRMHAFNREFLEYHNQSLKLSEKERNEALNSAKEKIADPKVGLPEDTFEGMPEDSLAFFNQLAGMEMAFGITSAFPDPKNPFYSEAESRAAVQDLLFSPDFSKELVQYCIGQHSAQLPFFQEDPGRKYLEDLDFLLRFCKAENYHTKAEITLT